MSKVNIELTDQEDGKVGILITVMDFDEKSNAIGLGQTIETFIARMVEGQAANEEEEKSVILESKPRLAVVN